MKFSAWLSGRLGDPDATHALRPRRPNRAAFALPLAVSVVLAGGVSLWAFSRWSSLPSTPVQAVQLPQANEQTLLAAATDRLTLFRFGADPHVLVAVFPSLHMQAMALNRVAAFVERPGVPHNHVLDDATLHSAMDQGPGGFDTYYYGHDYRVADLARFYATAASDGIALNDAEATLQKRLAAAGFFASGAPGALISLPPAGPGLLDPSARATILHHELSHGAYFTDPAYAAYVTAFWRNLTAAERAAFRKFLAVQGYDTENDDLMRNETQAYLMFTADPRMFDLGRLGLPEAAALRTTFVQDLPLPWLRKDAVVP